MLSYTIYENRPVICRNARIENLGSEGYILDRMWKDSPGCRGQEKV